MQTGEYEGSNTVLGIVLAGGQSKRMKSDKAMLPYGEGTLLSHSISLMQDVASEIVIIADRKKKYEGIAEQVWRDIKPECGPAGGLYTAFKKSNTSHLLAIACDMPFLEPTFLQHLVSARENVHLVIPRTSKGIEPLCTVWSRAAFPVIDECIHSGQYSLRNVIRQLEVREITTWNSSRFSDWEMMFFNINNPNDYSAALKIGITHERNK